MDEVKETNMSSVESNEIVTQKQVEFIQDTFMNNLPVRLYGGYAEEALLEGDITRKHHDVDMVALRKDKDQLKTDFENMGSNVEEVFEKEADKPYKLLVKKGEVETDVALLDWDDERNQPFAETRTPDGRKVRAYFDHSSFNQEPQKLGDLEVKAVSPLMQMQMREAFWLVKRGEPRQQDLDKQEALRQRFFPDEESGSPKFKPEIVEIK